MKCGFRILLFFWLIVFLPGCGRDEAEFFVSEESAEVTGKDEVSSEIPEQEMPFTETTTEKTFIYVDVCGAVAFPGVYELEADSRVFQAVEAAGGFLPEAARQYVNQAESIRDGQQIYIPTGEEMENIPFPVQENSVQSTENKVNLNTADAAALMTLSGIGESKAQAILAYREANGGFSSIEEIMNVQGIKESTFVKIKDDIVVG